MNEKTRKFIKDVIFTTCVSFFLITFLYLFIFSNQKNWTQPFEAWYTHHYIFLKFYCCVLPFCLCLGFANRIFQWKGKNRAMLRVLHILATFAAYFIFMDLLFAVIVLEGTGTLEAKTVIMHTIPYFALYPLTVLVNLIGRAIFMPKTEKKFKSILD